jgi:hypothetical protein
MNYLKSYCNLVRKAEQRGYTKKKAKEQGLYVEGHHTFPLSIFGKNNRIAYLTAREHYIAHALLERICIRRYGLYHWKSKKMIYAFWGMNNQQNNLQERHFNSKIYESARIKFMIISKEFKHTKETLKKVGQSIRNLGENHPSRRPESKERMRKRMLEYEYNPMNNPDSVKKLCKYRYEFISPEGEIFIVDSLNQFCRERNFCTGNFSRLANGIYKQFKGWTGKKISKD